MIDPTNYGVFLGGRRLTLTSTEFRLLHVLVENRSTVVTHQTLEKGPWGSRPMARLYLNLLLNNSFTRIHQ